ncbi:alpha/beta fold hydrolase [Flaviaesturariibacter flavus]|uniref:Alpha/beta fold hydrolase n=1 Tax=Flaviaesturariibacter flavus TaxID=2502780 RepID=A0A4R1BK92_9BACT|nr:alpha/beta fold hydrolase [Flaviaesturariibacter flavus]TCJ17835.1 alpha/beta fold hydrolase [Flaviaesturariibacter flavus]
MRLLPLLLLLLAAPAFGQRADTAAYPAADSSFYTEEAVVLHTATGDIHGTLTLPHRKEAVPVALIIAGSGPTDRDGNSPLLPGPGNSLRYLAHQLAKNRIASLRFDKRGIGESAGAMKREIDLRFDDYVADARAWLALLAADKRFTRRYVIGHSEGALIGALAADGTKGYVSIAGAGFPAQDILKKQLAAQLPDSLMRPATIIIDSLAAGHRVQRAPRQLIPIFRPSVQPYMISWFAHDPAQIVAKLKMPVLIIQGDNDIQVAEENGRALKAAAPKAKLLVVPGMNHALKFVAARDPQTNLEAYSNPALPVMPAVVAAIVKFIK